MPLYPPSLKLRPLLLYPTSVELKHKDRRGEQSQGTDILVIVADLVRDFLSIFLEVRWQHLVPRTVQVSVFPRRFHQLHRPVSDVLTVHLFQTVQKIVWIAEGNKPIAPCLASASVSDNSGHIEGRVPPEDIGEDLIVDFVAQVATKDSIVILGPILHRFVFPDFTGNLSKSSIFNLFLFLFLYLFGLLHFAFQLLPLLVVHVFGLLGCLLLGLFLFGREEQGFGWVDVFALQHRVQLIVELLDFLFLRELDCLDDGMLHLSNCLLQRLQRKSKQSENLFAPVISQYKTTIQKVSGWVGLGQLAWRAYRVGRISSQGVKLIYQQFFLLVYLHDCQKYPMITTRSTTPRPTLLKYNYKTSATPARSAYPQPDYTSKKDSRLKSKNNQKTQHYSSFHTSRPKEWREPLAEVKHDNLQKCLDLADYHKRQSLALKKKNDLLEEKLAQQGSQIQQLKQQILNVKRSVTNGLNFQPKDSSSLNQANRRQEDRIINRQDNIGLMRETVSQLRDYNPTDNQTTFANVQLDGYSDPQDPNEVSRRKEYFQVYENTVGTVKQGQRCEECSKKQLAFEQMKLKYNNDFRNLQEELAALNEKKLMAEVLEQQITNKNECIDYLTRQLSGLEGKSAQLLSIIDCLQRRLDTLENRNTRKECLRERGNSSFHSFSDYKY